MEKPVLFRKRLIPEECICLKDDEILYFSADEHILVTKWHALKPKQDLHHGYSCYFLDQGFKVSKFYREDGTLLYWYCDIIDVDYPAAALLDSADSKSPRLIATDLLADVIIYPDGFVKVVDLDELVQALEIGSLNIVLLKAALNRLNHLLNLIYSGDFKKYQDFLEQYEIEK
jgi:hypothetical protein